MPADIPSLSQASAAMALARAGVSAGQIFQLLQPMKNLVAPGQAVTAEVVNLKQTGDQTYQLLLKLIQGNGTQSMVPVTSTLPLTPGTSLTVTQASANTLSLSLQQINNALNSVLTRLDTQKLPVGTLLQAKVLTSQVVTDTLAQLGGQSTAQPAQPGAAQNAQTAALYRSIVVLLNTAQAGTTLSIESPRPLPIGSLLNAQVQGSQSLNFVPLSAGLDQLAATQQLATQQGRQGSLDVLINALQTLQNSAATSAPTTITSSAAPIALPAAVQDSIDQLLADLPDIQQMSTAKGVAQAISASGTFMEAKLLAGTDPMQTPDLKANLSRLIAQILPGLPDNTSYDAVAASNMLARMMPAVIRSALGTLGQVGERPQSINFPLPSRSVIAGEKDDLEMLLKLAAAAVSRVQSHQLGGLEQTRTHADGTQTSTWQMEIPMRNGQDVVPLQVRMQRDDVPEQEQKPEGEGNEGRDAREKLWKIELAFDLDPLGPLQVQAQLLRGNLSSQMWAERADAAEMISRELGYLRERLIASGLTVGELACSQGKPAHGPRTKLEKRWIDENA
ncbi:flagellar hook-length control protein FliK [Pseudomonas sp. Pseusp122]|uniref:flagellar hook-length control protein FliK n=1 Tax=unclassified Pseudomonas TaxID=196821 RepID=UPI0039A4B56C